MKPGPIQYDRTVEPCHRQVRGAGCADKPIPFDEYLHKRNRQADTIELSSIAPPSTRVSNPQEPNRAPGKLEPEAIHEEVTREVTIRYEIPSELMTGRLIDLLL